jgi:hypothetical protein
MCIQTVSKLYPPPSLETYLRLHAYAQQQGMSLEEVEREHANDLRELVDVNNKLLKQFPNDFSLKLNQMQLERLERERGGERK